MSAFLLVFYGVFLFVSWTNAFLMRRPRKGEGGAKVCVLIPARNEEANLGDLVPALLGPNPDLRVYVYDDDSSDATGAVASRAGARVIRSSGELPQGWTGKNHACYQLANIALEDTDAEWFLFLDADVRPKADFIPFMRSLIDEVGRRSKVITGFPHVIPGEGIEPLFLGWVGWVLLSTNPYGIVSRTKMGHNRFTNGQIHCWNRHTYLDLQPNEAVRNSILEDVKMGRLLAKRGIPVEVANLSSVLEVRMYRTWRESFDGMSKNSYEITGSVIGTLGLALLMLFMGWGWLLAGPFVGWAYLILVLSGIGCSLVVRARGWGAVLLPVVLSIGAATLIRSMFWHRTGKVSWKGRDYSQEQLERKD